MNLSANNYNIIFHFNKKKNLIDKKINNFKNVKIKADLSNKNEIDTMFKILKKKYKNLDFCLTIFQHMTIQKN